MGDGALAVRMDAHLERIAGIAGDGLIDHARSLRALAPGQGVVDALDVARFQLLGQVEMRGVVLGHHQQSGGILVQAVQDARAQGSVHVRQALELEGQGVGQGPGMDAVAGMGDHALGLVHHQDMLVLIGDGEGDVLRNQGGGHVRFRHEGHGDFVAFGHGMVLFRRFAVDEEAALLDPFLDAAARRVRARAMMNMSNRNPASSGPQVHWVPA